MSSLVVLLKLSLNPKCLLHRPQDALLLRQARMIDKFREGDIWKNVIVVCKGRSTRDVCIIFFWTLPLSQSNHCPIAQHHRQPLIIVSCTKTYFKPHPPSNRVFLGRCLFSRIKGHFQNCGVASVMRPTAIAAIAGIKLPFVKRRGFSKIEGCPSFLKN